MQGGAENVTAAMATVFVWLRYSSARHLTWQRNYNTQPRILGEAQARLTNKIAEVGSTMRRPAAVLHSLEGLLQAPHCPVEALAATGAVMMQSGSNAGMLGLCRLMGRQGGRPRSGCAQCSAAWGGEAMRKPYGTRSSTSCTATTLARSAGHGWR